MSNEQPKEYYTQGQLQQILDVVRENAVYDDGDFYFKVDGDKITNAVRSLEPTRSRPHTPAPAPPTDETIAALISENARIGSELKRMTEKAERLSGEHDATIARNAREDVLKELEIEMRKVKYTSFASTMHIIESLRSTQQQAGDP